MEEKTATPESPYPQELTQRLAIGTVQFGLAYGISNTRGQVTKQEAANILDEAFAAGVTFIDTAQAYGESEAVLGDYLSSRKGKFSVISKYPPAAKGTPGAILHHSISLLRTNPLYGYLLHHFELFEKQPAAWDAILAAQDEGEVFNAGFSLYHPHEAEYLLERSVPFQLVQVPYSLLDRRFESAIEKMRDAGAEIHVRSVFLQGLVFMNPDELHPFFKPAVPVLKELRALSADSGVPVEAICLCYALCNRNIDKVVIGVDSIESLRSNLSALQYREKVQEMLPHLDALPALPEEILLPSRWPKR